VLMQVRRLESGAYECHVEINVDISTTREGVTRLDDMTL
jgi:hypothetical protein